MAINPERVNFIQIWKDHKLGEGLAHLAMYNTTMRNAGNPKYEASVWRSKSTLYIYKLIIRLKMSLFPVWKRAINPELVNFIQIWNVYQLEDSLAYV